MNKDTVTASVIGFGLGLIAAIALWIVPRLLPKTSPLVTPVETVSEESTASSTLDNNNDSISITDLQDGMIVKSNSLSIRGQSNNLTLLIVSNSTESFVVPLKSNGDFETAFTLAEGNNDLIFTVIDSNKKISHKNYQIFYFEDKL